MLAQRVKLNVFHHHHPRTVVGENGLIYYSVGILSVASCGIIKGARSAERSADETLTVHVFTQQLDDLRDVSGDLFFSIGNLNIL